MFHRLISATQKLFTQGIPVFLLPLLIILLVLPIQSCKKGNAFDSQSVTLAQLKGTWRGRITTFKNNTRIERTGDITLFQNTAGDLLDGIFNMGPIHFLEGFMFEHGTLFFHLINSDSTNPQCANWNLGGYVYLQEDNLMIIRIAGNECGPLGKQFVTYEGSLILINPGMDPTAYFSFARTGRSWTYTTQLYNGTPCEVPQEVLSESSPYLFTIRETNDCGWPITQRQFTWQVEPFKFSVMVEGSTTDPLYTFYLDAVVNKQYRFIAGDDTTYLTLMDPDIPVNVPAGSFRCGKYRIDSRIQSTGNVTTVGTLYLSRQYGFIKREYTQPADSTNIQEQVLNSFLFP